jgi:hypothetical protein
MANVLPPPPVNDAPGSWTWLEWYRQLRQYIATSGSVPWYIIDFAGSSITDIASRSHNNLQTLQGGTAGAYYHLTQDTFTNVISYLSGGTTGQGWNDLLGMPNIRVAGANDPTWNIYQGSLRQFQYSNVIMNEMWFTYHIQHDYKPGSDIHIHTHWSQTTIDSGGPAGVPGNVKWYIDVSYAKGHNQAAFSAPITTSITQTASGTQYQHMLAEVQLSASSPSGSQIDSALLEPDGVLIVRLYRNPADAADTLNQAPFLHFCDIHYQTDRVNTKNKAPNFYA